MRIGIVILPDQRWSTSARRWRQAEEYGFDHAWTYDHLSWRDLADGPWFDAATTLTAAAAVTDRIGLGTWVASPNFRHPVHFVRELISIDDISGGRLRIGAGAGGTGFDSVVLGGPQLPPRERVDRFAEFLDLLDRLLRTDRVDFAGTYYTAVDARTVPGPVQTPRPPLLVAANGPRTCALAAKYGDGWITTGKESDAGPDAWWHSVAALSARFDAALAAAGRERETVARYLDLDSAPVYSLSSPGAFSDAVGRAAALGFTDVVSHWPRTSSWYAGDEKVLETVAAQLADLKKLN